MYNSYGDDWAWFAEGIDETMENVMDKSYNTGCFAWSGFDYYGEPQPYTWPSVMSYWDVMDNCGFTILQRSGRNSIPYEGKKNYTDYIVKTYLRRESK